MGMKTIYFVRHGESDANVGLAQGPLSPLTERGRSQARFMAERAGNLKIEAIIASTMTRAQQTAGIIAEHIGKDSVDSTDLLVECRRTSYHDGKSKHDPESIRIDKEISEHFTEAEYRYSDEENFDDLKKRAGEALAYLESRPEKHLLVVTHGYFMRVLVAYAAFGPSLTAHECQRILHSFHTENTGLTVFRYDVTKLQPWWIWIWNDHAHLADA